LARGEGELPFHKANQDSSLEPDKGKKEGLGPGLKTGGTLLLPTPIADAA